MAEETPGLGSKVKEFLEFIRQSGYIRPTTGREGPLGMSSAAYDYGRIAGSAYADAHIMGRLADFLRAPKPPAISAGARVASRASAIPALAMTLYDVTRPQRQAQFRRLGGGLYDAATNRGGTGRDLNVPDRARQGIANRNQRLRQIMEQGAAPKSVVSSYTKKKKFSPFKSFAPTLMKNAYSSKKPGIT